MTVYPFLFLHTFLHIEMSQVRRRCRRTVHQAAKPDRRKSLFDPLQSGAQLHIDLSRGVVEVREEKPVVLGMIYSGMLLRGHGHWPGLIMLLLQGSLGSEHCLAVLHKRGRRLQLFQVV